jgi:hypothetical protein
MSLTSFIKIPEVREGFNKTFTKPEVNINRSKFVAPKTKNYSLIGTAFDYLLRFYLQKLNKKNVISTKWIAEQGLGMLNPKSEKFKKATKIINNAKIQNKKYIKTGKITRNLFVSILKLAQLDSLYRIGRIDPNLGKVDPKDIIDLKNLFNNIENKYFKSKHLCILNPTFGEASMMVGGADADLIIDDTIIDIKTTIENKFSREFFNQLMGYYTLYFIGGVDVIYNKEFRIKNIALYSSRYGALIKIPVEKIIKEVDYTKFISWFKENAKIAYPNRNILTLNEISSIFSKRVFKSIFVEWDVTYKDYKKLGLGETLLKVGLNFLPFKDEISEIYVRRGIDNFLQLKIDLKTPTDFIGNLVMRKGYKDKLEKITHDLDQIKKGKLSELNILWDVNFRNGKEYHSSKWEKIF